MAELSEATCDLSAMVLSVDDDMEEDLMQHGFERLSFRVSIDHQGVKAGLPGLEQMPPLFVQRAHSLGPRLRIHFRPGRKPGKRLALDARQPDFLRSDDVGNEFSKRIGGVERSKDIEGAEHAGVGPQVIGEEAAQGRFIHAW